jgi:FMN-dependent NADH-azoreductase
MTNILIIDSSPNPNSVSRQVADDLLTHLKKEFKETNITTRNLTEKPFPHFDASLLGAFFTPTDKLTDAQKETLSFSDTLINELVKSDILIINTPMHNFSISSSLKAWIDHVVRRGKTFQYTATGPVGLLDSSKKAYVVVASGGVYSEGWGKTKDFVVPYLQNILGFIGLTDPKVIRAEGVAEAYASGSIEKVLEKAHESIVQMEVKC